MTRYTKIGRTFECNDCDQEIRGYLKLLWHDATNHKLR